MTKEQQEFLEKHFKAGEYSVVTVLVKNEELTKFMDTLKNANLTIAALPGVAAGIDFANPDVKGTAQ